MPSSVFVSYPIAPELFFHLPHEHFYTGPELLAEKSEVDLTLVDSQNPKTGDVEGVMKVYYSACILLINSDRILVFFLSQILIN